MNNPIDLCDISPFSSFEILPEVKVSIVIPVKNEEDYIVKTLKAFSVQVDLLHIPFNFKKFEILILANNCTDNSVELIKDFQRKYPALQIYLEEVTLPPTQANIGYVRRLLKEVAYNRLCQNDGGIIMTTDGDTSVAPDWIAQNEAEIDNGADAVGGRILLCPEELNYLDELTSAFHFKDEQYHLLVTELEAKIIDSSHDPSPRHHQHFNGSFAMTTDCYKKSGGIPDVIYLEDCAYFDRLQQLDAKVRHSNKVIVHTSARCVGRAEIGLSYQLNLWKNSETDCSNYYVESCPSIVERFLFKRELMHLWEIKQNRDFDFYTEIKKIKFDYTIEEELYNNFNSSQYFGEWYAQVIKLHEQNWKKKYPNAAIDEVIMDLQKAIANYSASVFSQTSIR